LSKSFDALFRMMLGDFDYDALVGVNDNMSINLARIYFILYILIVVLLMLNMFLAIVMKTYDIVAEDLATHSLSNVLSTARLLIYTDIGAPEY